MGIGRKISWAALGVVLGAALVLGGSALATGGSGGAAPPRQAGADAAGRAGGVLAGAVHGDGTWAFADGSTKDLSADFGRITAVGSDSITVHRADGQDVTVPIVDATCVRQRGQEATVSDLHVGEVALVIQQGGQAQVVRAGLPLRGAPCGLFEDAVHGHAAVLYADGTTRTFDVDRGLITNVGSGSVTMIRRDRQRVTTPITDQTTVTLDCRPASPADLKAGDVAMTVSENGAAVAIHAGDGQDMDEAPAGQA
jgi:hypothetical protein